MKTEIKQLFAGALALLAAVVTSSAWASGGDPKVAHIDSGEANSMGLHEALAAATAGQTVYLDADADLTGYEWAPIVDFKAKFDGQNHKISNLSIVGTANNVAFIGNIPAAATGTYIRNFTIENVDVAAADYQYVAAVLGQGTQNHDCDIVSNVTVCGTINIVGYKYVGGIFGHIGYNSVSDCHIDGGSASASFIGQAASKTTEGQVGGIFGMVGENDDYQVSGCSVKNVTFSGCERVGAIAGRLYGTDVINCSVENCVVKGPVDSTGSLIGTSLVNGRCFLLNNTVTGVTLQTRDGEALDYAVIGSGYATGIISTDAVGNIGYGSTAYAFTAGTFTVKDQNDFTALTGKIAAGYVAVAKEGVENTYEIKQLKARRSRDGAEDVDYTSLAAALADAQEGDTVKLLAEADAAEEALGGVLDLNGCTLDIDTKGLTFNSDVVVSNGTITTKGSGKTKSFYVVSGHVTLDKTATIKLTGTYPINIWGGTFDIYGTIIKGDSAENATINFWNDPSINIYDGAVISSSHDCLRGKAWDGEVEDQYPSTAKITIYGGTFTSGTYGIFYFTKENDATTVEVKGGTFNGKVIATYLKKPASKIDPRLTAENCSAKFSNITDDALLPLSDFLADGYAFIKGADGYYTVQPAVVEVYSGETVTGYYGTIDEAVKAAWGKTDCTIKLCDDAEFSEVLYLTNIVGKLDLNGKTLAAASGTKDDLVFFNDSTLVITNGTFDISAGSADIESNGGMDVTVASDATIKFGSGSYGFCARGKLTVNGSILSDGMTCIWTLGDACDVTVNEGAVITGTDEDCFRCNSKQPKITINGGTVTCTGEYGVFYCYNKVAINDIAIKITINGGTINGKVLATSNDGAKDSCITPKLTAENCSAKFSDITEVSNWKLSDYLEPDYEFQQGEDGYYRVRLAERDLILPEVNGLVANCETNVAIVGHEVKATFKNGTKVAPEGEFLYIVQDDGSLKLKDGETEPEGIDPIAKVISGETEEIFASLADAVEAAQAGDTVALLADTTLTETLTIDKAITLDLCGEKVALDDAISGYGIKVTADGMAITNGQISASFTAYKQNFFAICFYGVGGTLGNMILNIANADYGVAVDNDYQNPYTIAEKKTVVCENVRVTGNGVLFYCQAANMTLDGNCTATYTGELSPTAHHRCAIYSTYDASVTVAGGTYTVCDDAHAVHVGNFASSLTIAGGTFTGDIVDDVEEAKHADLYPDGYKALVKITGGTFTALTTVENPCAVQSREIYGGTFTADPSAYLAPGYGVKNDYDEDGNPIYIVVLDPDELPEDGYYVANEDGTYSVELITDREDYAAVMASFGEFAYCSLDRDTNYCWSGWSVWLTNDVAGTVNVAGDLGTVTLNLNGYSITAADGEEGTETTAGGDGDPAIVITPSAERCIQLTIVNRTQDADSSIIGGDGGGGHPAGAGASAIIFAEVEGLDSSDCLWQIGGGNVSVKNGIGGTDLVTGESPVASGVIETKTVSAASGKTIQASVDNIDSENSAITLGTSGLTGFAATVEDPNVTEVEFDIDDITDEAQTAQLKEGVIDALKTDAPEYETLADNVKVMAVQADLWQVQPGGKKPIEEIPSTLVFALRVDFAGKTGLKVWRKHDGKFEILSDDETQEEYCKEYAGLGLIEVYGRKFSEYGIVWIDGIPFPTAEGPFAYDGAEKLGVTGTNMTEIVSGSIEETEAGEHTVVFKPAAGVCWTDGSTTNVAITYTITPAEITGAYIGQDGEFIYGATNQTVAVTNGCKTVNGQAATFLFATAEDGEYSAAFPQFKDAGLHTYWYKVTAPNHADTAPVSATVAIAKAQLTVTAEDKEAVMCFEAPEFTYVCEGLLGEDTAAVLDPAPALGSEYTDRTRFPDYEARFDITNAVASAAANYDVTFVPGVLTAIGDLTIAALHKAYGDCFEYDAEVKFDEDGNTCKTLILTMIKDTGALDLAAMEENVTIMLDLNGHTVRRDVEREGEGYAITVPEDTVVCIYDLSANSDGRIVGADVTVGETDFDERTYSGALLVEGEVVILDGIFEGAVDNAGKLEIYGGTYSNTTMELWDLDRPMAGFEFDEGTSLGEKYVWEQNDDGSWSVVYDENAVTPDPIGPATDKVTVFAIAAGSGAGKVTPNVKSVKIGRKVTLKAKAAKGSVFAGWYLNGYLVSQETTYKVVTDDSAAEVTYVAQFILKEQDTEAKLRVGEITGEEESERVWLDEVQEIPLGVEASYDLKTLANTATKVSVSSLPSGLKFNKKTMTITGAPTVVQTKTAKITVKNASNVKSVYRITFDVKAMPDWSVGSFDGVLGTRTVALDPVSESIGSISLTVAKTGRISGKVLTGGRTYSFSAKYFDAYDITATNYVVTVTPKSGKYTLGEMTIALGANEDGIGVAECTFDDEDYVGATMFGYAVQNVWKRTDLKNAVAVFPTGRKAISITLGETGLVAKFYKNGKVRVSGKVVGDNGKAVSVSCSTQLQTGFYNETTGENALFLLYVAPKKNLAAGICEVIPLAITTDDNLNVTDVQVVVGE